MTNSYPDYHNTTQIYFAKMNGETKQIDIQKKDENTQEYIIVKSTDFLQGDLIDLKRSRYKFENSDFDKVTDSQGYTHFLTLVLNYKNIDIYYKTTLYSSTGIGILSKLFSARDFTNLRFEFPLWKAPNGEMIPTIRIKKEKITLPNFIATKVVQENTIPNTDKLFAALYSKVTGMRATNIERSMADIEAHVPKGNAAPKSYYEEPPSVTESHLYGNSYSQQSQNIPPDIDEDSDEVPF